MSTFSLNIFEQQLQNTTKLDNALLKVCKKIHKTEKSVEHSNVGYQSPKIDINKHKVFWDLYKKVEGHIRSNLKIYDLKEVNLDFSLPWININKAGDFNWPHIHVNSHFSGIYYLKVPKNSGRIIFHNPFTIHNNFFLKEFNEYNAHNTNVFKHMPSESSFLMFPGNLKHAVEQSKSKQDRISISFDVKLK